MTDILTDPITQATDPKGFAPANPAQPTRKRGRPPKPRPAAPEPDAPKVGRPKADDVRDAKLLATITDQYRTFGAVAVMAAIPAWMLMGPAFALRLNAFAAVCSDRGDQMARSLVNSSRNNPKLRKMLESVGNGSGYGAILLAHAPLLVALVRPDQVDAMITAIDMAETFTQAPPSLDSLLGMFTDGTANA